MNLVETNLFVVLAPGWDSEWTVSKIFLRQASGTIGLGFFVETSHNKVHVPFANGTS